MSRPAVDLAKPLAWLPPTATVTLIVNALRLRDRARSIVAAVIDSMVAIPLRRRGTTTVYRLVAREPATP